MFGFFILSAGIAQTNDAVKFLAFGVLMSESFKKPHFSSSLSETQRKALITIN
jgi:hypothetical protein